MTMIGLGLLLFTPAYAQDTQDASASSDTVTIPAEMFSVTSELSSDEATGFPRGPLTVRNLRPYEALFGRFTPEGPDVLPQGRSRLGLQLDIANNLLRPNPGPNGELVDEDNEMQRLQVSWRKGIAKNTEFGLFVPVVWRNGGILDGPISAYHKLLGVKGDGEDNPTGRDNLPRGESRLFFQDANGNGVNAGNAFGLGDVSLTVKRGLSTGGRSALAARAGLKLPTGSASKIIGSGGFDFGVGLDGRVQLGREWFLYGNVGATALGKPDVVPNARRSVFQGGAAIEWRKSRRESYIAQLDASTRTVRTGNPFADKTPVIASVGYRRILDERRSFSVSFSENGDWHNFNAPFLSNIGPDFSITVAYDVLR